VLLAAQITEELIHLGRCPLPRILVRGFLEARHQPFPGFNRAKRQIPAQLLSAVRRQVGQLFARTYTGGSVFHGFTAALKEGPYDANPLRDTAEEAAADATSDQEVRDIRFSWSAANTSSASTAHQWKVSADTWTTTGHGPRRPPPGARVYIVVPQVKAVTAQTAEGIEVTLTGTIVWEPVSFETRIAVLA